MKKSILLLIAAKLLLFTELLAQSPLQYSYQFYQKLNSDIYNAETRYHSALKPFVFTDSLFAHGANSLLKVGIDSGRKSWVSRKLFNEHLIEVKSEDYFFYADYLPDLQIGRDFSGNKTVWLNTRGYQIGGSIGDKFSFYTSGFENQARFPNYLDNYINTTNTVPGQSYDRSFGKLTKDWSYVTANISYTPSKYLNITFGYDKNFVGDGYRSLLLSDYASPYPFLRLTGKLGNVQYMAMWAAMQDPSAPQLSYEAGNRKKGGVFHYLDWNITNRFSLGFFDSIIWADTDDAGNVRGFDWGYANPIIFLRPVEAASGSPDNALIGFTAKYEFGKQLVGYGQFSLDEFEAKNFFSSSGSSRNKYAWQLGFRGADLFKVENLNYLIEYNTAKPYTFSSRKPIINYAHYNESLAHPFGANFREILGLFNYSYKRFDFTAQLMYAKYGLDINNENYGKNIFYEYSDAVKQNGNYTTQGIRTDLYFSDVKVAYLINPKYNLRLEIGGLLRQEKNSLGSNNTAMFTFGLRSGFRNLYYDF